jgi:hypothetical protein
MTNKKEFSCALCSSVWHKSGSTNCWSADPTKRPAKPGYCPTQEHGDVIKEYFELYKGDSQDAKIAKVAAKEIGRAHV